MRFSVLALLLQHTGAYTCNDGSEPGASGCCADTGVCPTCCMESSASQSGDSSTTCGCRGCAGDTLTYHANCTVAGCGAYLESIGDTQSSALGFGNCELCIGHGTTCVPSEAAGTACLSMMPGASMSLTADDVITCGGSGASGDDDDDSAGSSLAGKGMAAVLAMASGLALLSF